LEVGFFIVAICCKKYWSGMEKIHLQKSPNVELFTQYISELVLEVEGIKLRAERNDMSGIKEHLERMNAILMEIMDTRMDLAEKCSNIAN